ncbi:MAG: HAD family hydrolase [Terracidiphilus sp.]
MHSPVRMAAIDMDGTLLPSFGYEISRRNLKALRAAQDAGIQVVIATGRRAAFTAPLLEGLGLRADMPLITSNGAVTRTLGGEPIDRWTLDADVARGLCGLLRGFGVLVFTFDQPGRGELVLEDLDRAEGRMELWVEANREAIEVVSPLEQIFTSRGAPIQGMVAGPAGRMREAERTFAASQWSSRCECLRTEYPARDLAILDLLPSGISKRAALERLACRLGIGRLETLAIGDNWNDVGMLEWAGQAFIMGNASRELRSMAKMRGWKQAPGNDRNGVAVVLEAVISRLPGSSAARQPGLQPGPEPRLAPGVEKDRA